MTLEQFKHLSLPDAPGVYFFKRGSETLYIGRATSLKDRVRSYFFADVFVTRGRRIVDMVALADGVEWQETRNVLEAIFLEADLIKRTEPPYNAKEKDNKSFLWAALTDEEFPQLRLVRGRELALWDAGIKRGPFAIKQRFGPFGSGAVLREALKLVRRIFPYRDEKCTLPVVGKRPRPCFSRQIGLCPGTCVGAVSVATYARTVRRLSLFLSGKVGELTKGLERDMRNASKEEQFEEASAIARTLAALSHLSDVSLIKHEVSAFSRGGAVNGPAVSRIEGYDVAHLRGDSTVGAMVVIEDGEPLKSKYRTFRIKAAKAGDDPGALRELLTRRLAHEEWGLPDVVVVDGGAIQERVAHEVLTAAGLAAVPVVSVTKDERHRPRKVNGDAGIIGRFEGDILLANAEAHRFSINRHRKTRSKRSLRGS